MGAHPTMRLEVDRFLAPPHARAITEGGVVIRSGMYGTPSFLFPFVS